jgi:hypothetical protein
MESKMLKEKIMANMSKQKPLMRTYKEPQFRAFDKELQKKYPELWHAIQGDSRILFAMYDSGLFFVIMGEGS